MLSTVQFDVICRTQQTLSTFEQYLKCYLTYTVHTTQVDDNEETIASRVHRFRIFGWVLFSVITVHILLKLFQLKQQLRRQLLSNLYDNISHHTKTWIPSREFQLSEREQFDYLGISIFKTIMMMFGEYEHSRTLIYPLFGSTEEATIGAALVFIFYIAFLLLVPIILMNLLASNVLPVFSLFWMQQS
ncbi:hypothetical protein CSKR_203425 [Clonorchis sinensis]|uniref:Uncharacterized protein n=1 Tax=Clonorchis sinensis TaxID=79923 RepID=A0A8T1MBN4_CLOSI|nr:hypothetical protein CSKR_203425 [Clonorchis sinensis]